jgi:transcription initiation factor TFIIE subunit beta
MNAGNNNAANRSFVLVVDTHKTPADADKENEPPAKKRKTSTKKTAAADKDEKEKKKTNSNTSKKSASRKKAADKDEPDKDGAVKKEPSDATPKKTSTKKKVAVKEELDKDDTVKNEASSTSKKKKPIKATAEKDRTGKNETGNQDTSRSTSEKKPTKKGNNKSEAIVIDDDEPDEKAIGIKQEPDEEGTIQDIKAGAIFINEEPDENATNQDNDNQEPDMSSFDRQHASFLSSMSAAASKLGSGAGTKRSLAPPSPSPSVGSTTSAAAAGSSTPRKDRETPANVVYSQPAMTGTGDSIISQMAYAVSWLRSKDEPQHYSDVLGYLSITARPENEQEFFVEQMRRHPHIQWIPDPDLSEQTWRSGTYVHRPKIPGVKSKTQLLAYLQKKTDASGVSVKDLKDGWPDCEAAIAELEKEHKVLVVRAKKDGSARMVWLDDPSLFHEVDPQLKLMWARTEVPSVDNIVQRLVAAQQKPASEDPRVKAAQSPKMEKKKKAARRRTGKSTNVHMEHLLKDYSHMKR